MKYLINYVIMFNILHSFGNELDTRKVMWLFQMIVPISDFK